MSEHGDKQIIGAEFTSSNEDCPPQDSMMEMPKDTTVIPLSVDQDTTATELPVPSDKKATKLPVHKDTTANELFFNQDLLTTTELAGNQDTISIEIPVPKDITVTATELLVSQAATITELPVSQAATATELPLSQAATATELPVSQAATATELPVSQAATATELPASQAATATKLLVSQAATATELPASQAATANELPVSQAATATELPASQAATATKLPVCQAATATELPASQAATANELSVSQAATANELPIGQDTTHLDGPYGPQCLVDKIDSSVELILIDDDPSVDASLIDESTGIESGGLNRSQKNTVCELCGSTVAIYTCPGCHVKTCSLPCVKEHKRRFFCNGERKKTAFVDISEYSESHMLNDYRFLEDANRQVYSTKADAGNKRKHNFGGPNHLTKRCKLLVNAAYKRGVKVQMVAQVLTKHKLNTSYYTVRLDLLSWHIEWLFVASNTVVKDEKVPENTILIDAARKWTNAVNHPELRKPLEDYKKENLDKSRFLLKVDCLPANRQRYFEMKSNLSLAENLKGHCLTEFPIIAVLPPSYPKSDEFILFSSADLLFMDPANRRHVMTNLKGMDFQTDLIAQLMDPKSHIYSTQPDVIDMD
ncbi:unnamed protein product [Lymnaea stagnalis]|uniref:HIT-type domain-containing protein n=1 Tax=Lymnaea stagnalis TaxID=6523 RepID=A0AAV2HP15_LYMST